MTRTAQRRAWIAIGAAVLTAGLVVPSTVGTTAQAADGSVSVFWSSEDGTHRLTERPAMSLTTSSESADVTINVDPGARYQTIEGNGTVLEGTSVWNIMNLSPHKRDEVMNHLFNPTSGNAYNLVRIPIGSVDQSPYWYTYDDTPDNEPDPELRHFSIQRDIDLGVVALAKQALAINPDIQFYMSMWSAPAWMKSNKSLTDGGEVLPEYYPALARYQRMAIQAYQQQGIPIRALTPQNEPHVTPSYPTGYWSAEQMHDYIKNHLGPELRQHIPGTEIWIGDDNVPSLREFIRPVLEDPVARQYVGAIALHDYAGHDPAELASLSHEYDLPLHLTERSYYGINGEVHKYSGGTQLGMRRLIDHFRAGLNSWTYWISFTDEDGGPSIGPLDASCCSVPFTAPAGDLDDYSINRDYYLYGQLTRFVDPGATRIGSDQTSVDVNNVAFRNPDGSIAVVVANGAQQPRSIRIQGPDGVVMDTLPPMTMGTYSWAGRAAPTDPRLGTFRVVNQHHADGSLHATREHFYDNPEAYNVVASPVPWDSLDQYWTITSAGEGYYRLTSLRQPTHVLQATGERYRTWPDVHNIALTPSWWNRDDQLWRIDDTGDGGYRFVNKATGAVLQHTADVYPYSTGHVDVFDVVTSPAGWDLPEQRWRLVR